MSITHVSLYLVRSPPSSSTPDTERLIAYLRKKISNLDENDFTILRNQSVDGQAFVNMTQNEFSESPFNFVYGKAKNLGVLINSLNSQSKFYHKIVRLACYSTGVFLVSYFRSIYYSFL